MQQIQVSLVVAEVLKVEIKEKKVWYVKDVKSVS